MRNRLKSARRRDGHVTLADVAEVAGVSASTASRALNGRGELSEDTRAAVIAAAERLHFEPSALARSLRTRTTFTVGFVVPDVSSPFYAAALKGAQGGLEEAGYRVMLMDAGQDVAGEVAALRTLLHHRVDGLLLATTGLSQRRFRELVTRRGTPCVFFDSMVDGTGDGSVGLDNAAGIDALVEHLAGHGHRRIALLAGSPAETSGREREAGFRSAMAARGLRIPDGYVAGGRWTSETGRAATEQLLALDPRPTAVVASSVELALGCLAACRVSGVSIPEQVAVATFDDAYFAALIDPPLTAVAYDATEVGRRAAELLVEAMADDEAGRRDLTIPVSLVARRSCGCDG